MCVYSWDRDRIVCKDAASIYEVSHVCDTDLRAGEQQRSWKTLAEAADAVHNVAKALFIAAWEVERPGWKAETLVGGSSQACLCIKHTPVSSVVPPPFSQAFLRLLPPAHFFPPQLFPLSTTGFSPAATLCLMSQAATALIKNIDVSELGVCAHL